MAVLNPHQSHQIAERTFGDHTEQQFQAPIIGDWDPVIAYSELLAWYGIENHLVYDLQRNGTEATYWIS